MELSRYGSSIGSRRKCRMHSSCVRVPICSHTLFQSSLYNSRASRSSSVSWSVHSRVRVAAPFSCTHTRRDSLIPNMMFSTRRHSQQDLIFLTWHYQHDVTFSTRHATFSTRPDIPNMMWHSQKHMTFSTGQVTLSKWNVTSSKGHVTLSTSLVTFSTNKTP